MRPYRLVTAQDAVVARLGTRVPWARPVRLVDPGGRESFACRVCLAAGTRPPGAQPELERFPTRAAVAEHLERDHPPLPRPGVPSRVTMLPGG